MLAGCGVSSFRKPSCSGIELSRLARLVFLLCSLLIAFPSIVQTQSRPNATKPQPKPAPQPQDSFQRHYAAARTFQLSGDQKRAAAEYSEFLDGALRSTAKA